jgi:hypothetical protein
MHETPGSDAWSKANEVIAVETAKAVAETPAERHSLRMRSFYVDLQPDGFSWSRPREATYEHAL